jgi:hypothetical protein
MMRGVELRKGTDGTDVYEYVYVEASGLEAGGNLRVGRWFMIMNCAVRTSTETGERS